MITSVTDLCRFYKCFFVDARGTLQRSLSTDVTVFVSPGKVEEPTVISCVKLKNLDFTSKHIYQLGPAGKCFNGLVENNWVWSYLALAVLTLKECSIRFEIN